MYLTEIQIGYPPPPPRMQKGRVANLTYYKASCKNFVCLANLLSASLPSPPPAAQEKNNADGHHHYPLNVRDYKS